MIALSAMTVEGPGSETEVLILTEPYTLHTVVSGSSPRGECNSCVYQDSRFCSVATAEQMERSVRRLIRNGLPIPPCLKWVE